MPWKELEHTADVGLEITASTMEELVTESAAALYRVIFGEVSKGSFINEDNFVVSGLDLIEIMVSWMNELVFLIETRRCILQIQEVHFEPSGKQLNVTAALYEIPQILSHVKAVTYGSVFLQIRPPLFRVYLDL